jgi:acyl-CoA thioester hydrolase
MRGVWDCKVRFAETDAAGIVYYPNFYKWMDQATHEMFEAYRLSTRKLLSENRGIPLVETHCRFKHPLKFGDRFRVESKVTEVRDKVFTIEHRICKGDILAAEGYEIRAWIERFGDKLKAVSIPVDVRKLLTE